MSQFDHIIERVRGRTEVGNRVKMAHSSFQIDSMTVRDGREVNRILMRFMCHLTREVRGYDLSETLALGQAIESLKRRGSIRDFYGFAISGVRGGVSFLLDYIASDFEREEVEHFISGTLSSEVGQDYEMQIELMIEFIRRAGHLLPSNRINPAYLAQDWVSVLRKYCDWLDESQVSYSQE